MTGKAWEWSWHTKFKYYLLSCSTVSLQNMCSTFYISYIYTCKEHHLDTALKVCIYPWFFVFGFKWLNVTFNNISAIQWRDSWPISKFRPVARHRTGTSLSQIQSSTSTPPRAGSLDVFIIQTCNTHQVTPVLLGICKLEAGYSVTMETSNSIISEIFSGISNQI